MYQNTTEICTLLLYPVRLVLQFFVDSLEFSICKMLFMHNFIFPFQSGGFYFFSPVDPA